ncbi:uncharacterized protein LACBIDRAFT_334739 [Laccaria bicolor S238N-H82]|uniref:Predicted protein n=1 Tax=Laccaria bicolor (strain S238N-H82 / ATCC MYA-4686) TaxID=486041 RepID=B0E047_LACBS|nr:uncharacterized protein LACBIDRAFT_334739 [Laccaria bicolor S238N-H82]EDQ99724.1 predicted protein [Laccaria bicolor S238N-H82]|eukprot:XP_001889560.1 predicted protein [Laccaria bicolor S238N-H82]
MFITPKKRTQTNENATPTPTFVNHSGPPTKKTCCVLQPITPQIRDESRKLWLEKDKEVAKEKSLQEQRAAEEKQKLETSRLEEMERVRIAAGYTSLFGYLSELFGTKDCRLSSQVSQMLIAHGKELLDAMHIRQKVVVDEWMSTHFQDKLRHEGFLLGRVLQPDRGKELSSILQEFLLETLLKDAQSVAPTLFTFLSILCGEPDNSQSDISQVGRKKKDVIISTLICIIAQTRNEKASKFQLITCIYLLACGASRSLFSILNHAGFSLSYSSAMGKIKDLGEEKREFMKKLVCEQACLVVWDNLNIVFRVNEQRQASKDHFDNGMTVTLIPLYNVPFGSIPLSSLQPQSTRRITFDIQPHVDLLPSLQQVTELEASMLWQIEEILFTAFPQLHQRFKDINREPLSVLLIPVHKTEQYPLPAALIDESTIDGTIEVMDHIFFWTLGLTAEEIEKHGPFILAGDQLMNALSDMVCGAYRDDRSLVDNPSKLTKTQVGLFHGKIAGSRCTANEHWGVANSKAPWSLWRINTLLGRKAISAGWNAKQLPPFRPIMQLVLRLALPANILDGFRLFCLRKDLNQWVSSVSSYSTIKDVVRQVFEQLCSARRVSKLQRLTDCDIPHENIILFNHDALILAVLTASIKRGDIGAVVNVLAHWMGKCQNILMQCSAPLWTSKLWILIYGTLLCSHGFLKLINIHSLRHAYLMNWLANLLGRPNSFKELDLLQEHQNFWLKVRLSLCLPSFRATHVFNLPKIIYNAKGSNRSWEWLSMVSVSIFALRDVIRQVQMNFKTPYNGKSHTSPAIDTDIATIRAYLEEHTIQMYTPERQNNKMTIPARDLMAAGAAYATSV